MKFLILFLLSGIASAQICYTVRLTPEMVYDGDSIRMDIDLPILGYEATLHNVRVRLVGIDAPEIRGIERPQGLIARDRVRQLVAKTSEAELCLAGLFDKDAFGRLLGALWLDGVDTGALLISEGLAEVWVK